MDGVIRIEIEPRGSARVFIGQPRDDQEAAHLWELYRALRGKIDELESAAKRLAVLEGSNKEDDKTLLM